MRDRFRCFALFEYGFRWVCIEAYDLHGLSAAQKREQSDHADMQGIINIEEIFQIPRAASAVIERKQRDGGKGKPLDLSVRQREKDECHRGEKQLLPFVSAEENENGTEHAPDTVIQAVIRVGQKGRQKMHEEKDRKEEKREKSPCIGVRTLNGMIQRIDQKQGARKRDQNTLIE